MEKILKSSKACHKAASLSSPCSDFISSLATAMAGNTGVALLGAHILLLFPWEPKGGQCCAQTEGIYMNVCNVVFSVLPGTFSAYL